MAKNKLQIAPNQLAPDEIKAQEQLARIFVGVVTELENSTTQAMVEACVQPRKVDAQPRSSLAITILAS